MVMNLLLVFLLSILTQTDVSYKPKEEFEIKLDYQFKQRSVSNTTYSANGDPERSHGVLPYVNLNLKILKAGVGEVRYKVSSNLKNNVGGRKFEVGDTYVIDAGFTADIKDRVTAHEYTILFLSETKEPLSKIFISVAEDGGFYVNGEKRGKF